MSKVKWLALIAIAVVGLMELSLAQGPPSSGSPLKGTVKAPDGKPMEGVTVSMRLDGKTTITQTVFTDLSGRYYFPALSAPLQGGQYKIWAQAVGFETAWSAAPLSAGKAAERDFTMKTLQDFSRQLSGSEWMASLPDNTPQDRSFKRILGVECNVCHTLSIVLQNRFDITGWTSMINFMQKTGDRAQTAPNDQPYIASYKEGLAGFLARVRGPSSAPLNFKVFPRPTGDAAQAVITEYDIPPGHLPGYVVSESGSDWSLGTASRLESAANHDAIWSPQCQCIWFADSQSPERTVGKLDPKTGKVTDYQFKYEGEPLGVHDINVDQMGDVWVNGPGSSFLKLDAKTEKFQLFPTPVPPPQKGAGGSLINIDSKGNIWNGLQGMATLHVDPVSKAKYLVPDPKNPSGAVKLNPKTGEYTYYNAVTPTTRVYGVGVDGEDNAYFTQPGLDRLGRVDARTGKVTEILLGPSDEKDVEYTPLDKELAAKFPAASTYAPPWQKGPRRQAVDLTGNAVYVSLSMISRLAKIDTRTQKVTEYPLPWRFSWPYGVTVDKNHMVYVGTIDTDRVLKFNPFTEKWTAYVLPTRGTDMRLMTVDNDTNPPTVWAAYYQTNKMARLQFRTAASK
ncbi:MAG: carboxypeptidase regulatory-like domain-containing protein [Acidobacteria bacterium]|nr:carboxypeptidase regulatory-like domain-containing protein [Acidobacteriota bacterium]